MTPSSLLKHAAKYAKHLMFFIIVALVWELTTNLFNVKTWIFPSLSDVIGAVFEFPYQLLAASLTTLFESVAGFALGASVGVLTAILLVSFKYLKSTLYPLLAALNSFPKSAIAPTLVIWFGLGVSSKITMAFIISYFPILVNTTTGLEEVDPESIDLMRILGSSKWQILRKLRLPNSLISMFNGFKIALPLSIVGAIVGEFVGAKEGLGYIILIASSVFNTPLVFACLLVAALISLSAFYGLSIVERVLLKWSPSRRRG